MPVPKKNVHILDLEKTLAELKNKVSELEAKLKNFESAFSLDKLEQRRKLDEFKLQTNYQLTKDARLARELGKKK